MFYNWNCVLFFSCYVSNLAVKCYFKLVWPKKEFFVINCGPLLAASSVYFLHFHLLLWNYWTVLYQTWQKCEEGDPFRIFVLVLMGNSRWQQGQKCVLIGLELLLVRNHFSGLIVSLKKWSLDGPVSYL